MGALRDLTGLRFGRLHVIERDISSKGKVRWICKCDCGNMKSIISTHLLSGATTSCGCYQKEKASEANGKHGLSTTSLHNRWKAIKQRCLNPQNNRYDDYGERGISLCAEWCEFQNFYNWAIVSGYKEGLTLDRIDNSKGYYPDNCRWVDYRTNGRNRRSTVKVEGLTLGEIADQYNISYSAIRDRYYRKIVKSGIPKNKIKIYMLIPSQADTETVGRCND